MDVTILSQDNDAAHSYYYQSAKKLYRVYILKYTIRPFKKSLSTSKNLTFQSKKNNIQNGTIVYINNRYNYSKPIS